MNGREHSLLAIVALAFAFHKGWLGLDLTSIAFILSYAVFTLKLSPDIDLKLPFIAHRGITHELKGLAVLGAILFFAGMYYNVPYLYFLVAGGVAAWLVHYLGDLIYDSMPRALKNDTAMQVAIVLLFGIAWNIGL